SAEIYPGNYTDHVERVKAGLGVPRPSVAAGFSRPAALPEPGRLKPAAAQQKNDARKHAKRLKKIDEEIAALEARIASAERERERNDVLLCSEEVYRDGERTKKVQAQNADLKSMIELL